MTIGEKIYQFHLSLKPDFNLPPDVEILNPFTDGTAPNIAKEFYYKFYNDNTPRIGLIGINPGRFGAGVTTIPFTDPIRLETHCQIKTVLPKKQELSSVFIYQMIEAFGGASEFYSKFLFNSVSPLGFTKSGKNINYYDLPKDPKMEAFILSSLKKLVSRCIRNDVAVCLGEGKNFNYLNRLNERERLFNRIIPLPHPRFIMQYKSKFKQRYIDQYLEVLHGL